MPEPRSRFHLTRIADTRVRFREFRPYVASLNDLGVVAFQAGLESGATGLFVGSGGPVRAAAVSSEEIRAFRSHPDIDGSGALSVYADLADGREAVLLISEGRRATVADTSGALASIGPLGPTMDERGGVAFRATTRDGRSGVLCARANHITPVADLSSFRELHGLPVLVSDGRVIFRADDREGRPVILCASDRALEVLAGPATGFVDLGRFPSCSASGAVVFSGATTSGEQGIFRVLDGRTTAVVSGADRFESYRGALTNDAGTVVFFATPRGGRLGVFALRGDDLAPVVAIGEPAFGSTVVELALNPVSLNGADQVAIRLLLENGLQVIARADPV